MEQEKTFEEQLEAAENKIKDSQENLGDVEVRDAMLEKASLQQKYNKYEDAIKTYIDTLPKSVGIGKKMDVHFLILQIYLKQRNLEKFKDHLNQQQILLDQGGDWERKNRLKVYEGIYCLMIRDITKACKLFLDSVATFNSSEIISYNEIVSYTVLTSIICLDRQSLKKKVHQNPEVVGVLRENQVLKSFLESFLQCDYKTLFQKFAIVNENLSQDQYLSIHRKYLIREYRVVFYSQFLESYKTVTLNNMAKAFGVSVQFIDRELSELISSRRINCKIDKVAGIIESSRADDRNQLYNNLIKQGDYLLNRVQKLSRLTDL
ncbi:unnamed protein product (macronuclear) [Paramecium tetraurelia]|uniref:PCI domain-containing protein n=1 Tax=Paramecium tetraurelia TaxID=5888 RepID=A0BLL8_PARTE|nr:uncharacterized protein GSPATT00030068001 [Paramecium tetraurelia]CAK59435.1 unnamed protein product [Paramecium tetraurelia]|eukprot:XP_001426833.1 hypothetical protein (macronuclear) [Paramecium tetraurelia strain d4-2]